MNATLNLILLLLLFEIAVFTFLWNKEQKRKLSYTQLKTWMAQKKKFTLVEVLVRENYDYGHVPGAINIPADKFEKIAPKVLKKKDIIVLYCRDKTCMLSKRCSDYLVQLGYETVYHFPGGKLEWIQRGEPLQTKTGKHCTLAGCF